MFFLTKNEMSQKKSRWFRMKPLFTSKNLFSFDQKAFLR